MTTCLSKDSRHWLYLLLALALVRGLIYALVTPPWQAPDETGHFEYAWLVAHQGRLPSKDDLSPVFESQLIASLYEWRYGEFVGSPLPPIMPARLEDLPASVYARDARTVLAGRFSLAYLWQALFLVPVRGQDLALQLLVARFSSILLSLGIVWLAFRIFDEMLPARPKVVFAMALVVVLMPQHTFINSTAGDGTLAELMAAVVLYCWALLFRRGASLALIVVIPLGTLLAVLSKATTAFLIPLDAGLAMWWLLRQRRQLWSRRNFAYMGVSVVVASIGVWVSNQSGLGAYALQSIQAVVAAPKLFVVDGRGTTLGQALLGSHDSFWAYFGWMALPSSPRWYGAILLLIGIAGLGWLSGSQDEQEAPSWPPIMMGAALVSALVLFVWTALVSSSSGAYEYQGRYLFPVVVPFAFLLVGGWLKLLPAGRQNMLFVGVLFLAVFDAWSVMGYVIPYFYYH